MPSPIDENVVDLFVSGQQGARPATELVGCRNGSNPADETNSLIRLDIINVPLNRP